MTYKLSIEAIQTACKMLVDVARVARSNGRVPVQAAANMVLIQLEALGENVPWYTPKDRTVDLLSLPISDGEIVGCKALLLEIIRRAAYDWVLYRTSKVYNKRKLAEGAYSWLFKEGPGHLDWFERNNNDKSITSLVAICSALELDIEMVRGHIRRLTVKNVMSIGRPAEYRKQDYREYSHGSVGAKLLSGVSDIDDLLTFDGLIDE